MQAEKRTNNIEDETAMKTKMFSAFSASLR
jgi:hypothetical protein